MRRPKDHPVPRSVREIAIDPALWKGTDPAARLAGHFSDIVPWSEFVGFIHQRKEADPTAAVAGFRRIYDRYGDPVLVALVTWRGKASQWRFPLIGWFTDPEDGERYLVFEARLRRIGLDTGYAIRDGLYFGLLGVSAGPP